MADTVTGGDSTRGHVEMCGSCEVEPAELWLTVATLDGRVLDTLKACRGCVVPDLWRVGLDAGPAFDHTRKPEPD